MAKLTGFLGDYQLGHLTDQHPTLAFQPSGPSASGYGVYAPELAVVVPVGETGYFEAELQPTDILHPATHYTVSVQWGFGRKTQLPWKLSVPSAGGVLADLLRVPSNPAATWVGTTPPPEPSPGTWWLNPETGDLEEWSN